MKIASSVTYGIILILIFTLTSCSESSTISILNFDFSDNKILNPIIQPLIPSFIEPIIYTL